MNINYLKYLKYKKKYNLLKLQLGGVINKATDDGADNTRCEPICVVCGAGDEGEETFPEENKIVLTCGCCFHNVCLFDYISNYVGDINTFTPNGIRCINRLIRPDHPDIDITPDELEEVISRHPDLNLSPGGLPYIDIARFRHLLLQHNLPAQHAEDVDDPYHIAISKPCPDCNVRSIRYHGHGCHHIECRNCQNEYCYVCLNDSEDNARERDISWSCACTWNTFGIPGVPVTWSSFCYNNISPENIVLNPVPHDNRCGCVFCPECRFGHPCDVCTGQCLVCLGIVKPGIIELYKPEMGDDWLLRGTGQIEIIGPPILTSIDVTLYDNIQAVNSLIFNNHNFKLLKTSWLPRLNNIVNLNLSYCKIQMVEKKFFSHLPNLKDVNLSNNILIDMPRFNSCIGLNKLNLSYNKIQKIHNWDIIPPSLLDLRLNNNQINELAPLDLFMSINILYLNNNKITDMTNLIVLRRLRILNLTHNNIINIPHIQYMRSLSHLNLGYNKIEKINTENFMSLKNLKFLHLNNNKINIIEKRAIVACSYLKELNIKNNPLNKLYRNSYSFSLSKKNYSIITLNKWTNINTNFGIRIITTDPIADYKVPVPDAPP